MPMWSFLVPMLWRPLVACLVEVLQPALPSGFEAKLDAEVGGIALFQPDVPGSWVVVDVRAIIEQSGVERKLLDMACWSVLSTTQDVIAEATGEPWPGRSTELPPPEVEVVEDEIRLSPSVRSLRDVEDGLVDPSRGAGCSEHTVGDVVGVCQV